MLTCDGRWFHGDLGRVEAETRLAQREPGTFLVRFSSIVGYFTITRISSDGHIFHQRIVQTPGQNFRVNYRTFPSLVELIDNSTGELGLTAACPRSPYLSELFKDQATLAGYIFHE